MTTYLSFVNYLRVPTLTRASKTCLIFQVAADLPFFHESEVDLLNRICRLGSYFKKFQTFCRKYSEVSPFIGESPSDGE